ncbi:MAG: ABC-2 transporter permease [Eggerthellaceae bacterium]|jgi:hypothetical protein|nr:ABC-2 transporter permease [Eggerthellaceae bacterium]
MKALILKDLYIMWTHIRWLYIGIVVAVIVLCMSGTINFLFHMVTLTVFLCYAFQVYRSFHYDEESKSDRILRALPLPLQSIVAAKYLFSALLLLHALLISAGILFILSFFIPDGAINIPASLVFGVSVTSLCLVVMLPLLFKYGSDKGGIIYAVLLAIVVFVPLAFRSLHMVMQNIMNAEGLLQISYYLILLVIILILGLISYRISYCIMRSKFSS